MGGAARTGDDHLEAAVAGRFGVFEHFVGHAVGAHDARFEGNPHQVEHVGGVFHHLPVGVAAHNDADERSGVFHGETS